MASPRDPVPGLRELQARFAAALESVAADDEPVREFAGVAIVGDDGIPAVGRLGVYRNNTRAIFQQALERTYPVILRRVGQAFFERLAAEYRSAHPSRSGDLHWVGARFPGWLETRLSGTEYAWLGDLARLEWACEESLVARQCAAVSVAALAGVPPERLEALRVELQPSLRPIRSEHPVWSIWSANQPDGDGQPVDMCLGEQCVLVTCAEDGLLLHCVPRPRFEFVAALQSGETLGRSLESSGLPVEDLAATLQWMFGEGLVVGLSDANPGER